MPYTLPSVPTPRIAHDATTSSSLRHSRLFEAKFEKRNMNPHSNKTSVHLALPIQIRHLPQRIEDPGHVRAAEQLLRRVKVERHGAAVLVEVLNGGRAAPGARFGADEADAFQDAHFGRRVGRGGRRAAEDVDVGVPR